MVACLLSVVQKRAASAHAKSGVGLGLHNESQRLSVFDMGRQMRANTANGTGKCTRRLRRQKKPT